MENLPTRLSSISEFPRGVKITGLLDFLFMQGRVALLKLLNCD